MVGGSFPSNISWRLGCEPGVAENPLPLRLKVSAELTFLEIQSHVAGILRDAVAHASVPFSEVLREIRPDYAQGGNSCFNVSVWQCQQLAVEESGDSTDELAFRFEDPASKCRERFVTPRIYSIVARFWKSSSVTRICWQAPAKIPPTCSELNLLSASERNRIAHEWNQTSSRYEQKCVHKLFKRPAAKTPDRTAVIFQNKTLSYRELNGAPIRWRITCENTESIRKRW